MNEFSKKFHKFFFIYDLVFFFIYTVMSVYVFNILEGIELLYKSIWFSTYAICVPLALSITRKSNISKFNTRIYILIDIICGFLQQWYLIAAIYLVANGYITFFETNIDEIVTIIFAVLVTIPILIKSIIQIKIYNNVETIPENPSTSRKYHKLLLGLNFTYLIIMVTPLTEVILKRQSSPLDFLLYRAIMFVIVIFNIYMIKKDAKIVPEFIAAILTILLNLATIIQLLIAILAKIPSTGMAFLQQTDKIIYLFIPFAIADILFCCLSLGHTIKHSELM